MRTKHNYIELKSKITAYSDSNASLRVTIPNQIALIMDFKKGDELKWRYDNLLQDLVVKAQDDSDTIKTERMVIEPDKGLNLSSLNHFWLDNFKKETKDYIISLIEVTSKSEITQNSLLIIEFIDIEDTKKAALVSIRLEPK
jgi:hypothetical protein